MRKRAYIAIAFLLLCIVGCAGKDANGDDKSLKKVLDAGQLVLGLDENYPPMGYRDESGEIVGFDIDMAKEVCNRLGIELVNKPIEWDKKEDELNSGNIDCIWNGMSVSPERSASMCLSKSYLRSELVFVVMSDSGIDDVQGIKGKSVGVQSGSTTEDELRDSALMPDITIVKYGDNKELMEDLEQKKIDVAFIDTISTYYYSSMSNENLTILPTVFSREELAIGFRNNDYALRDKVQETIDEMTADGTVKKISEKWFGKDITILK
ncbi:MAG: amino acid ABC transporter substrate-binding protein [Lachnospiraceae bacterium]|nr:amino acid ABC transporter substrate-binding protein [Lachnospiraceae bacterium]